MIDIFLQKDVAKLFENKNIVFMGDSNIRGLYKDLLCLSKETKFVSLKILKAKMENSCLGDKLLTHGPKYNGRLYREERKANVNGTKISFYFLTCVYEKYVEEVLDHISNKSTLPDVLILNSCLWDITRWGPRGVESFKKNLVSLMKELKRLLPNCLVIWVTAPPIACEVKGGFLIKELQFLKYSLRFHVMEANQYARKVVTEHGFDIVDCHYHLKTQIHRRCDDGIHWMPEAVRYITNLLLTHISIAWNFPLPHRSKSDVAESSDFVIEKENMAMSDTPKRKPVSKMASVIGRSIAVQDQSIENCSKSKIEKTSFIPPAQSKKKKCSSNGRQFNFQNSHHAYLNRVDRNQRHKRIRQWQSSPSAHTPPRKILKENFYNASNKYSPCFNQHDSGYFPSPNRMPLLPSPTFNRNASMYFPSPSQIPLPSDPYPYQNYSPAVTEPMQNTRRVVFSPVAYQQAYVFPNFNGQYIQPVIDFTSSKAIPFGFSSRYG